MRLWPNRRAVERTDPLVGTEISLQSQISAFWDQLRGVGFSPRMLDRVWVANRCQHLNSQQISSMPLRFFGPPTASQPAWVSNPDPVWFPNGIGEALYAATNSMYGWGDAFLYITSRYADGFPSGWTVLAAEPMTVELDYRGEKQFRHAGSLLDSADVVQITRDPRGGLRGTSALRSYATHVLSAELSGLMGQTVSSVPNAVLSSKRKLTETQARALQTQWMDALARRGGAPAVLPPEIEFEQLAFSPKDLLLLDAQQFEARVVASAYGVPPFLLNLPLEGGLTYQNPEMMFEVWWRVELRQTAKQITSALSSQMLPRGQFVTLDAQDVLAPGFRDQIAAWVDMLKESVVTVDEFRAAVLRLPSLSEGDAIDELTVPSVAASSAAQTPANVQALRPPAQEVAQ